MGQLDDLADSPGGPGQAPTGGHGRRHAGGHRQRNPPGARPEPVRMCAAIGAPRSSFARGRQFVIVHLMQKQRPRTRGGARPSAPEKPAQSSTSPVSYNATAAPSGGADRGRRPPLPEAVGARGRQVNPGRHLQRPVRHEPYGSDEGTIVYYGPGVKKEKGGRLKEGRPKNQGPDRKDQFAAGQWRRGLVTPHEPARTATSVSASAAAPAPPSAARSTAT